MDQLLSFLPLIASAAAPYITEVVKGLFGKVGKKIPSLLKPVLSVLFGSVLGAVTGGDPVTGGVIGLAGTTGFKVGKKS
jgi:hypothetical protein